MRIAVSSEKDEPVGAGLVHCPRRRGHEVSSFGALRSVEPPDHASRPDRAAWSVGRASTDDTDRANVTYVRQLDGVV